MTEIEEKLAGIKGLVSNDEMARIKAKMQNPERTLCPMVKKYKQLPLVCIGYEYVCKYLNREQIVCNHPNKMKWQVIYSSPTIKVLSK
jgi:hypothetical protein